VIYPPEVEEKIKALARSILARVGTPAQRTPEYRRDWRAWHELRVSTPIRLEAQARPDPPAAPPMEPEEQERRRQRSIDVLNRRAELRATGFVFWPDTLLFEDAGVEVPRPPAQAGYVEETGSDGQGFA
jgi:hypothetical protein